MSKTNKIIFVVFLLLLGLLTYLEASEPEPVNWAPSYALGDKIPLGAFILFENLKEQPFKMKEINLPPYEYLTKNEPEGIYFFLNNNVFFDDEELDKLLTWVKKGNILFLSAENIGENFLYALDLEVKTAAPKIGHSSKPLLNLAQTEFKTDTAYLFDREIYHTVFSDIDTLKHKTLGISELYSESLQIKDPEINYLKTKYGKGEVYFHTTPQAFSNFFLLHNKNYEYVEKALAYLPPGKNLYWDTYYKSGKSFYTSPLYILLEKKTLKWAYYFAILGSLLFVLFEGKRKQRSIPVIEPLKNQTYQFTRTIAGLYLDRKDYKRISSKKIALFLEFVRGHFRIPTSEINEDFFRKLAAQSGKPYEEVKELFKLIQELESKNNIIKEELLKLNSMTASYKLEKDD